MSAVVNGKQSIFLGVHFRFAMFFTSSSLFIVCLAYTSYSLSKILLWGGVLYWLTSMLMMPWWSFKGRVDSIMMTLIHKGFDETRRLGLQRETEQTVRQASPPGETGMLVVDSVVPGGPAHKHLEPGDVLVRVNGEVLLLSHHLLLRPSSQALFDSIITETLQAGGGF
eukprot:Gb_35730 [translate_table: standard]